MTLQALILIAALAPPADCPTPFGEQHRHVSCYQEMLRNAEAAGDFAEQARAWMQLAWAAWQKADFQEARGCFERSASLSRKAGDDAGEARATNFLGLFMQTQLADYQAAQHNYKRALEIARRIRDYQQQGEALYHLAFLYLVRRDFQRSIAMGKQSLEARRMAGDRRGEGITLANLGMAYAALGSPIESLLYQEQALPLIHESGDRRSEADVLDHIGHALRDLRRYDESISYHIRALELRRQIRDDFDATLTLSNLAATYRLAGRLAEAAENMEQVIATVEAARENQSSKQYRATVLARKLLYYEQYVDLLIDMHQRDSGAGHDAAALGVSERARARLTLDAIERARAHGAKVESELTSARPLTAAEIQEQLLDPETMLLEYSLGEERSVVWRVTCDALAMHILPKREAIGAAARHLQQLLTRDARAQRHDLGVAIDAMSRLVLQDITVPKSVRRIVVVADGPLQYLPFSVLHLQVSSRPLIERVEIINAPSASTVVAMRKLTASPRSQHAVAVFADPVFGSDDPRLTGARRAMTTTGELPRLPHTRQEA